MYKIGIIGDIDSVMGFKTIGLDTFVAEDSAQASFILTKLAASEYAVIFITEQLTGNFNDIMEKYKDKSLPSIIPVPGNGGSKGIGKEAIRRVVERAVGANIFDN